MIPIRVVEQIRKNTESVTLLKQGEEYEVTKRNGVNFQYWRFKGLREALDKFNIEAELFCEGDNVK